MDRGGASLSDGPARKGSASVGPPGPTGPKGEKGDVGPQGTKGDQGDVGATGAPGANGANGTNGTNGANGTNGTNGTFTGSVGDGLTESNTGVISVELDQGASSGLQVSSSGLRAVCHPSGGLERTSTGLKCKLGNGLSIDGSGDIIASTPTMPLDDLSDVDTVTNAPTPGNVLKYNGTNWVPGSGSTLDTNTSVFSQKAQTTEDPALSNYGIGGYYRTGDIVIDPEGDSITGSWNGSAWAPDANTQITMHGHMMCLSHIIAGGPGKFGAGRSRDDSASGGLKDRAGATIVFDFPQVHPNPGSNKPDPYIRFSHGEDFSVGNIYSTTNQSHWMWRNSVVGIYLAGSYAQVWSSQTGLTNILTGSGGYSDDRLKFNETDVTEARAQELLRAVPICEYMKVSELMTPEEEAAFEAGSDGFASRRTDEEKGDYPASYWEPKREVGTIAQRLTGTAAEFIITPGTETESYKVKYDQLTCINTRVLQGLLDKVDALTARVAALEG